MTLPFSRASQTYVTLASSNDVKTYKENKTIHKGFTSTLPIFSKFHLLLFPTSNDTLLLFKSHPLE